MWKFILTRIALGLLSLVAVSALIFAATEILPGDVASAVLGQGATKETLAAYRHELGLDRAAYVRYFEWFNGALHGDLGYALTNKREILPDLMKKFKNTLFLAGMAALVAVPLAVGLGIIAAINEGKWQDKVANIVSLATISVPEFFTAYILM